MNLLLTPPPTAINDGKPLTVRGTNSAEIYQENRKGGRPWEGGRCTNGSSWTFNPELPGCWDSDKNHAVCLRVPACKHLSALATEMGSTGGKGGADDDNDLYSRCHRTSFTPQDRWRC